MNMHKVSPDELVLNNCLDRSDIDQDDLDIAKSWYQEHFGSDLNHLNTEKEILRAHNWGVSWSYFYLEKSRLLNKNEDSSTKLDPFDAYPSDWIIESSDLDWNWGLVFLRRDIPYKLAKLALSKGAKPRYVRYGHLLGSKMADLLEPMVSVMGPNVLANSTKLSIYLQGENGSSVLLLDHYFSGDYFDDDELGVICKTLVKASSWLIDQNTINKVTQAFSRNPKVTYDLIKRYPNIVWCAQSMLLNPSITLEEVDDYITKHL